MPLSLLSLQTHSLQVVGVAEATGPPKSTALGFGVPEKLIGLAWVRVSALSTPLGEAGHMVSGNGVRGSAGHSCYNAGCISDAWYVLGKDGQMGCHPP